MIISTNKSVFTNITAATTGKLRPAGNLGVEEFLAFKPSTVCKKYGFLSIRVDGAIFLPHNNMELEFYIQIGSPGIFSYPIYIIDDINPTSGATYISAHVNIPVGPAVDAQNEYAIMTTHYNYQPSIVSLAPCGIMSNEDSVYTAALGYRFLGEPIGLTDSMFQIYSIIAEYKEN